MTINELKEELDRLDYELDIKRKEVAALESAYSTLTKDLFFLLLNEEQDG